MQHGSAFEFGYSEHCGRQNATMNRDSLMILSGYWMTMTNPQLDIANSQLAHRHFCALPQAFRPVSAAKYSSNKWGWSLALLFLVILQPLAAQEIKGFENLLNLKQERGLGEPNQSASVTTSLTPKSAKPGDTVTLSISVEIPKGSHIYSMSKSFSGGTRVKFNTEEGVEPTGDIQADHPPVTEYIDEFKQDVEKYKLAVTFSRKYKVRPNAKTVRIQGLLTYQVCNEMGCLPSKSPFDEVFTVGEMGDEPNNEKVRPAKADAGGGAQAPNSQSTKAAIAPGSQFTAVYNPPKRRSKTTVRLAPADAQPGDTVSLEIRVDLDPGWHTFTTTLPEDRAATATELDVDVHDGLLPLPGSADFKADRPHSIKQAKSVSGDVVDQEIYENHVTWTRQFQLSPQASLSQVKVAGSIAFQVCDKGFCLPAKKIKFALPVESNDGSTAAVASVGAAKVDAVRGSPPAAGQSESPEVTAPQLAAGVTDLSGLDCGATGYGETDIRDKGVIYVLGVAFVFGLLALLTPCVFPMVPITVSFFLKQAEKRHSSPLKMALVYSGSIILTFTVLGLGFSALFGATYINTLANGIWLNLFLGFVLLFFSLNLLGLFDIAIPSWLLTFTGNKESSGGYLGVFFMALTFTLTSFTCTFAFLGLILVWAANGQIWWPLAGLVSFSTAFALPFFLLALFPSYLHKLPKSGGWMNRVKVVMGFIELAFMFKFLSVADIGWNGGPTLLDYHMVMTAWMVLAGVTGFYLIGKIRLPHDTPTEFTGVFPMMMSILFFGLAGYIGVGLFGAKPPEGFLGRQIAAFAPPQLVGGVGPDGPYLVGEHDQQRYLLDFEAAKQAAIREKKPLYIDFTGVNCINCRLMEKDVIAEGSIQRQLDNCIRVQLYCDVMPSKAVSDPAVADKLVAANQNLQSAWIGDATLPSYAVVSPDGKTILSKAAGRVSTEYFNSFMTCGVKKFKAIKEQGVALTAAEGSVPYIVGELGEKKFLDFEGAKRIAQLKQLPLAVTFNAHYSINTLVSEREFIEPGMQALVGRCVRVALFVDEIPRGAGIDPQRATEMVARNQMLQETLLHDTTVPSFLLLQPDGQILTQVSGRVSKEKFQSIVSDGLKAWDALRNTKLVASTAGK
ncbi:MAG: Protein-disulfide reductase [Planctomycetaceae bacterium]|nr:Protein-disulfide reductase [Planctomycetaceae bacterium]